MYRTRPVGLSVSTDWPSFDFETYSEAGYRWLDKWVALEGAAKPGLRGVGDAEYVRHPSTEVLSLAYDLKDGKGRRLWVPEMPDPEDLLEHVRNGGPLAAWNAPFDVGVWNHVMVRLRAWPRLDLSRVYCDAAKSRAAALPPSLERAGDVLAAPVQKDKGGKALLRLFSQPRNPTAKDPSLRVLPSDRPDKAVLLYKYNLQDVQAEDSVAALTPDLSKQEREVWLLDQRINERGVAIDLDSASALAALAKQVLERANVDVAAATAGVVTSCSQVGRLVEWCREQDVEVESLAADHLASLLAADLPSRVRTALLARRAASASSTKKLGALRAYSGHDGRARGLFLYHGARTGRTTGGGPQPTNLPRSGPNVQKCTLCGAITAVPSAPCPVCGGPLGPPQEWSLDAVEAAIRDVEGSTLVDFEKFWGPALPVISGCLRGLFVAALGRDLIGSDYSAIEAVALAELAGEEWRMRLFRDRGDPYLATGERLFRVSVEEAREYKAKHGHHHPVRKKGKIAELASGYGGWIGAWKNFGADRVMTEDEMTRAIIAWRADSPAIVEFWGGQTRGKPWEDQAPREFFGLEGAAVQAVLQPGTWFEYRGIGYYCADRTLYCRLLSGRLLTYQNVRLEEHHRWPHLLAIWYDTWNTNPDAGPVGWVSVSTYGPKLTENTVQAACRDVQWHGMQLLESAGYPIVLHVYDEDVAEVPEGFGSVEEFENIMGTMPEWAKGWPIRASGGWRGKRFRK